MTDKEFGYLRRTPGVLCMFGGRLWITTGKDNFESKTENKRVPLTEGYIGARPLGGGLDNGVHRDYTTFIQGEDQ